MPKIQTPRYLQVGPVLVREDRELQWGIHRRDWGSCERCPLHHTATMHVLAKGIIPAEVLLLGEGPGKSENLVGEPFCGPAGYKPGGLNYLIQDAFNRFRSFTYCISNVVACRPNNYRVLHDHQVIQGVKVPLDHYIPDDKDRAPTSDEAAACRPRLVELIGLVDPALVVLMGRVATQMIDVDGITKELGFVAIPSMSIYHPSYIVRQNSGPQSSNYVRTILNLVAGLKRFLPEESPTPSYEEIHAQCPT